ncbi:hypothetical protein CUMW_239470, partial [Citrus unshiu]
MNDHWVLGVVDILGGKISIYDSSDRLNKGFSFGETILPVADMIPLVLQKSSISSKHHPDCSEVISKIPWPIVRVRTSRNKNQVVTVEHFCCGTWRSCPWTLMSIHTAQQKHVTQFRQALIVKLFGHRSWKKNLCNTDSCAQYHITGNTTVKRIHGLESGIFTDTPDAVGYLGNKHNTLW